MRALGPTVHTKFHIDFSWWERQNKDVRVFMRDLLCTECHEFAGAPGDVPLVDRIDPETAEVTRMDALWECIQSCCSQKPDYITDDTPVLDSIFRIFIGKGNKPLSILELHERLNKRPPDVILRLLTKGRTYMGIRPV